jgi:hypothetical protein
VTPAGTAGDATPNTSLYNALSGSADGSGDGSRDVGDGSGAGRAGPDSVLLNGTDEIADALDSAADILGRRLGREPDTGPQPVSGRRP